MTNKANKGFVFSAYDKFFRFLLMDNHLFLSIYIGILSFKGYFEKYLESIYSAIYNPQIQISAESETKRSIFRKRDKTKRSKKESAQHSKSRNKSFVMTSVSAL